MFAVHGYPFGPDASTFIVETDEESWRRAGLDAFDVSQPPGPSDMASKTYLEALFAEHLDGHPLLVNNSRWGNFRTIRCARWRSGNVVILGDAAHTAHFSVGSGTKMALEDAAALAQCVTDHPGDLDAALAAFEAARRPPVDKIQGAAGPSLSWWEHFGRYHDHLEAPQFAFHFFSRAIPLDKLATRDPRFVADVSGWWADRFGTPPLATPLSVGGPKLDGRVVSVKDGVLRCGNDVLDAFHVTAPDTEAGLEQAVARPGGRHRRRRHARCGQRGQRRDQSPAVRGGPDGSGHARPLDRRRPARRSSGDPGPVRPGRPRRRVGDRGRIVVGGGVHCRNAGMSSSNGRGGAGLEALFKPRGIAVIGASASPGKLGAAMARSLATFPGPVVLVNDRRPDPAAGMYRSIAEAVAATGAPVDLAVLCVPAPATAGALVEAAAAGVRAALVCAGGFAEAGGPGVAYQADVATVVADTGLRLLGPNTSGFLAPGRQLVASFVPGADTIPAGRVSLVAGSGGILHALAFLLAGAGMGLHLGVGIGNGVDVTAADVLDHLAGGAPGPVALHVEGVTDGRRLVESVERLTEQVPVVALVVGRNDVGDFARSHTGALTPAWRTARAALRAAGAVLVDDEREMIDALVALERVRLAPQANPGVGLVTGQAGPGGAVHRPVEDGRGLGAAPR